MATRPLTLVVAFACLCQAGYNLTFSTYLGGAADWDQARDVCADAQGSVYVTGGVTSSDFPTTPGVYDRTYNTGGTQIGSGGFCDAFASKFDSSGNLVWSTYLGGPNYDRGYGIEVDPQGYVYVCGRAGPGFPVTAGAIQTQFKGVDAGIYGQNNGFVVKLEPDGSDIVWATYVGLGSLVRDFDVDDSGNVYTSLVYEGGSGTLPSSWFTGSYQPTRNGGGETGLIKIGPDGGSVLWATWLGGSGNEQKEANVRIDASHNVYIGVGTWSSDMPTTAGAHDRTLNGASDAWFGKLSPDGKSLLFGTYFGGNGDELGCSTHNLAVDESGNVYHTAWAGNGSFPTTFGSYGGGNGDCLVAKFSPTGALLASTYVGGSADDDADGVYVRNGVVFFTGSTNSGDFPVTGDAYQSSFGGGTQDGVLVVLSDDLRTCHYSTYMGGSHWDYVRSCFLGDNGNLYITGSGDGSGWPVLNAFQDYFAGGVGSCYEGGCGAGDVVVAAFSCESATGVVPGSSSRPTGSDRHGAAGGLHDLRGRVLMGDGLAGSGVYLAGHSVRCWPECLGQPVVNSRASHPHR